MEAHRYLWKVLLERSLPKGHVIHHKCENKFCVHPAHLELLSRHIAKEAMG
jgi:HNH endonuclease